MFLLPFLALGLVFALVLGGRLSRLATVRFRLAWTVFAALGVQVVLFSDLGAGIPDAARGVVHVGTYVLLLVFGIANIRLWALIPVIAGMLLNGIAIAANGGRMPVSDAAAREVGLHVGASANVSPEADRLAFLGDVFAIPASVPLANVFSLGDVLIGVGIAAFIVYASIHEEGERELRASRLVQPLATPQYRRLAGGRFVSHLGDWLTLAALIGWIYDQTGSTARVAVLLVVRLLPPIVGGGVAALVVDRLPKERLLTRIELTRATAVAAALGGVLAGELLVVYAAVGVSGALAAISNATAPSLVPSIVPDEQLPAANAVLGVSRDAAMAIGALGGGLALSTLGIAPALMADALTFVVAALAFRGLQVPVAAAPATSAGGSPGMRAAIAYVLRRRRVAVLVAAFATATLATGLTQASLPRFLDENAGLGGRAFGYGLAAIAAGLVLGELVVGFARVGPSAGRWIGAGLIVMAGTLAVLGLSEHGPTALFLLAVIGFVDGTTDVLFETVVQREVDAARYGAVFGVAYALMATTMTAAFVLSPLVNAVVDAGTVLVGAGSVLAVAGAVAAIGLRSRAGAAVPAPQPGA